MSARSPFSYAARSLPGPDDVSRVALPNGITILTRANFSSPSVTISGFVRSGSLFESDNKLGLADFTSAALTRGTANHTFDSLFAELEGVGASLGVDSGPHTTGFHGHALVEDLDRVLKLIAEVMRTPKFPAPEIEKLRHQLLTGLSIRSQDTADMADQLFDSILFRGHPYARPEDGTPATIKSITRKELVAFHSRTYGPKGMVIAIVGAVDAGRVSDAVHRAFGTWRNTTQEDFPVFSDPKPVKAAVQRHHKIAGKAQADLLIGSRGPRRRDPEYLAAALGNSILGQFGMMGRIGKSVRETSGLAYYAYSHLDSGTGPGSWSVSAGVNPANLEKAIGLIRSELERFVGEGITAEELADNKSSFLGRLPLSLESNAGVANALLGIERYGLGLDYYQRYEERISAITADDILAAARMHIDPARLVIATAGP